MFPNHATYSRDTSQWEWEATRSFPSTHWSGAWWLLGIGCGSRLSSFNTARSLISTAQIAALRRHSSQWSISSIWCIRPLRHDAGIMLMPAPLAHHFYAMKLVENTESSKASIVRQDDGWLYLGSELLGWYPNRSRKTGHSTLLSIIQTSALPSGTLLSMTRKTLCDGNMSWS